MKLTITKEKLFAALILLPYIEGNVIQNLFDMYLSNSAAIKAIVFFMIVVILLLSLTTYTQQSITKGILKRHYYSSLLITFSVISFLSLLFMATDLLTSVCMWLWLCVPMLYACSAVSYCRLLRLDITTIFIYMLRYFAAYVVIALVYYILFRGLFVDETVRFGPRGGGAVIFGYTMALVFALALHIKVFFKKFEYYLILLILTIGVFGTLSRGAFWSIIFCWFANFALRDLNRRKVVLVTFFVVFFFFFANIDFEALFSSTSFIGTKRLFNLSSFRRVENILNILEYESSLPLFEKMMGSGLGNVFPYISWWINVYDVGANVFNYNGYLFLVQPHNSFLYLILETGLIGLFFILSVIIVSIQKLCKNKEKCFIYQMLFFGLFMGVNLLDSVFFVQPGTAGSFWLLALLVVERHFQVTEREIGYV